MANMGSGRLRRGGRLATNLATVLSGVVLAACGGGGTGNPLDSGSNQTYLSVEASDSDGDTLQYQWRVTGGSIQNRNSNQTVWTMPGGPGVHFAYVTVSDGKGGYVEQQYAVTTDSLGTSAPVHQPITYSPAAVTDFDGSAYRLRFSLPPDNTLFTPPNGGAAAQRTVYMPDMQVQVVQRASSSVVFSGLTDLGGDVSLVKLQSNQLYDVNCSTSEDSPLVNCGNFTATTRAHVISFSPILTAVRNLRLFGHIGLADGGVCGTESDFFAVQSAATVQLQQTDGTPLTPTLRVNRFGDYALDAVVLVNASLQLQVQCESYSRTLAVPSSPVAAGYVSTAPIELSHQIPNSRPTVVKMVGNGADGNVRGSMVVPQSGVVSNSLPGSLQFLTFKGKDTPLSACMYYRALGAVKDCDSQGGMVQPISFEDWKSQQQFTPYNNTLAQVSADYINKTDLNLVRHMVATTSAANDIAFYVCNHPGPVGTSQTEVDDVIAAGLANQKLVACVAMEWSTSPGVNGGLPFTKFFTFAPDGTLLPSVNLDGRGEKYMPGTCIACHGGSQYNGSFPALGSPSPYLGSGFLPFDTGNFQFGSGAGLSELEQSASIHALNQLVRATEVSDSTAVSELVQGWYADGSNNLNKTYVPPLWLTLDAAPQTAGAAQFYQQIVGTSCRTCHASLGPNFNWDAIPLSPGRAGTHVCGGTAAIALNATMPNALISRDRMSERVQGDPALAALMTQFLGCTTPLPDPVYPKR
jgi:mono/diheme cytochrome c family protein